MGIYGSVRACTRVSVRGIREVKRLQRVRESVRGCDCKREEKKGGKVNKKKGAN